MLNRSDASRVVPGAMIVFGTCDSPAQLVEIAIEASNDGDLMAIWVRRGAGPHLSAEINDDLSNHVTWWP